jgi:CheY-like chemotaxis protein
VIGGECPSRKEILDAAAAAGIPTREVESGQAALDLLHEEPAACVMLLDLDLPDMYGLDFVKRVRRCRGLQGVPVVISPKSELSSRQRAWLNRARQVVLRDAGTPGELVAQVSRILGCGEAGVDVGGDRKTDPRSQRDGGTQSCPSRAHPGSPLAGHVVLVVDDDIRNLFALTSLLEGHDMHVLPAENGDEAIEQLRRQPDIEVVLLDIMMPGKDGYDTLKQIRSIPELAEVPVIAVTAKAMKGDREHCLKAGATDYIAKPVQPARLFEMLQGALRSQP